MISVGLYLVIGIYTRPTGGFRWNLEPQLTLAKAKMIIHQRAAIRQQQQWSIEGPSWNKDSVRNYEQRESHKFPIQTGDLPGREARADLANIQKLTRVCRRCENRLPPYTMMPNVKSVKGKDIKLSACQKKLLSKWTLWISMQSYWCWGHYHIMFSIDAFRWSGP